MLLISLALAGVLGRELAPVAIPSVPVGVQFGSRSASTTLTVTATVVSSCSVSAPSAMAFGGYTGLQLDAQADLNIICIRNTPWQLTTSAEPGLMAFDGPDHLSYKLSANSTHTEPFGSILGLGQGVNQVVPVFGRIPGGQMSAAGNYNDVITVVITY